MVLKFVIFLLRHFRQKQDILREVNLEECEWQKIKT